MTTVIASIRLLGPDSIAFARTGAIESAGVTHLHVRVVKEPHRSDDGADRSGRRAHDPWARPWRAPGFLDAPRRCWQTTTPSRR